MEKYKATEKIGPCTYLIPQTYKGKKNVNPFNST